MGEIYNKANQVVAWLGEPENHTRDGFKIIAQLDDLIENTRGERVTLASYQDRNFWQRAGVGPFSSEQWCGLVDVLTREWFTRTWVSK